MKKYLLAIVIALSAAGCTDQGGQEGAGPVAPVQDATPAEQVIEQPEADQPLAAGDSQVVGGAGTEVHFPQGIALEFPYVVRAQRKATSKSGDPRDWIGIEFQDGRIGDIASSIENSMIQAGFKLVPASDDDGAVIRRKFEKRGYGVVTVTIHGAEGQKLIDPASNGVIWLDFPTQRET